MDNSTAPKGVSESPLSESSDSSNKAADVNKKELEAEQKATPLRCFTGALTASLFSLLAYRLLLSVTASFANKPIVSDNPIAVNISAAVRTLVMGMVALGAGVFGVAALGLAGLGIQLLLKKDSSAAS